MKEYFVQVKFEDGEIVPRTHTAGWILNTLGMRDCYDVELKVWESGEMGELIPLELHGTWHDPSNPLYMKATRPDGSVAFDGYGTDH